jgi:uncharacterized protein YukE
MLLSNPKDQMAVVDAMKEISDSLTRIAAERDLIKEILEDIQEKYEIQKKVMRKAAKLYHEQTLNDFNSEVEGVNALLEMISVGSKSNGI